MRLLDITVPPHRTPRSGVVCAAALIGHLNTKRSVKLSQSLAYEETLGKFKSIRIARHESTSIRSTTPEEVIQVITQAGLQALPLKVDWRSEGKLPSFSAWAKSRIREVKVRPILLDLGDGDFVLMSWKAIWSAQFPARSGIKTAPHKRKKVQAAWMIADPGVEVEVPHQLVEAVREALCQEPRRANPAFIESRDHMLGAKKLAKDMGCEITIIPATKTLKVTVPAHLRTKADAIHPGQRYSGPSRWHSVRVFLALLNT